MHASQTSNPISTFTESKHRLKCTLGSAKQPLGWRTDGGGDGGGGEIGDGGGGEWKTIAAAEF